MFEPASQPIEIAAIPPLHNAWYLTGPTAAGKTAVGLELAERLNAEIISLDSMSVYRGMDIGTAKPSAADQARIPHHLLDVVEPVQDFSLAEFITLAHQQAGEIRARGKAVLLVGGTPLYLKSCLRGLYQGPPPDWEYRAAIEEEINRVGLAALRARLELVDPLSAAKLHPHDQRRMIRALEGHRLTGHPLSHLQTQFEEARTSAESKVFVLSWPRRELHARIDARVESMLASGLVEEVRRLLATYGTLSRTASQAVGYREAMEFLAGQYDMATLTERVKFATHKFSRHQETWFRGLSECRMVLQSTEKTALAVAEEILAMGVASVQGY